MFNDGVGGVEYGFRRAIVLFERDDVRFGVIVFKIQDVAHVRAAPAVN